MDMAAEPFLGDGTVCAVCVDGPYRLDAENGSGPCAVRRRVAIIVSLDRDRRGVADVSVFALVGLREFDSFFARMLQSMSTPR